MSLQYGYMAYDIGPKFSVRTSIPGRNEQRFVHNVSEKKHYADMIKKITGKWDCWDSSLDDWNLTYRMDGAEMRIDGFDDWLCAVKHMRSGDVNKNTPHLMLHLRSTPARPDE